jgi:predicted DsbA family dithiol-disulfide isomerase
VKGIRIFYFSDVLCVWAFFAEVRLAAVRRSFGEQVLLEFRLCSEFGDTKRKIATGAPRVDHLHHSARQFPEIRLHINIWRKVRPAWSLSPHLPAGEPCCETTLFTPTAVP